MYVMFKSLIIISTILLPERCIKPVVSFKINKESANQFLKDDSQRMKRNNDGFNEEKDPNRAMPNYERECVEENCDYNEIKEIVIKDWPGRDNLLKKLYDPTQNKSKKQTNISPPIYTKKNNPTEYYKQATKDLRNILQKGCEYYHPLQKAFYNTYSFAENEDIKLCDDYGTENCHVNGKTKTCHCKKYRNSDLNIRKGRYCEECHEDCFNNNGQCKKNQETREYYCDCPKLRIIATDGTEVIDESKYSWEHQMSLSNYDGVVSRPRVMNFCSLKVADFCGNLRDSCVPESTNCENIRNGYKCSCRDGYVPDEVYNCKFKTSTTTEKETISSNTQEAKTSTTTEEVTNSTTTGTEVMTSTNTRVSSIVPAPRNEEIFSFNTIAAVEVTTTTVTAKATTSTKKLNATTSTTIDGSGLDFYFVFEVFTSRYTKYFQSIKEALEFIKSNVDNKTIRLANGDRITIILSYNYKDYGDNLLNMFYRFKSTKRNDFYRQIQLLEGIIDHQSNVQTKMIYTNVTSVLKGVSQFIRDEYTYYSRFDKSIVILFTNGRSLCRSIFSHNCLGTDKKSDKLEKTTFKTIPYINPSYSASKITRQKKTRQNNFQKLIL